MANPSSGRERERERERPSSSSRHSSSSSRTISSTTLLLVLSLVLAVLAVLLSLPSRQSGMQIDPATGGLMSYLTPKRTKDLIAREGSIAQREAEVAKREAELLGGSPGGIVIPTCSACPLPATSMSFMTITEHAYETSIINPPPATITQTQTVFHTHTEVQEVIKEVTKEVETFAAALPVITAPVVDPRFDDLLNRETRVSERERDVGRREELVGRRETDATYREQWIMDQLVNDDEPEEEEVVYERPRGGRKQRVVQAVPPPPPPPVEPVTVVETVTALSITTELSSIRVTVTVPEPAATRVAAGPVPVSPSRAKTAVTAQRTPGSPIVEEIVEEHVTPTVVPIPPPVAPRGVRKVVEVYEDEEDEEEGVLGADGYRTVVVKHPRRNAPTPSPPRPTPKRWFGGRF
ncbi:hypothetical protein DL93DRAFT_2070550 [Clavulina sp. PMI_390]|nr:hypothetical protein DL93DRAFT_2070550 [Clavulina sp. PMI_390]